MPTLFLGFDSEIHGSTNQQPEPECSCRYQCPIFSKIGNVTQAFRCCNYNRNRAEKLPTATQTQQPQNQPTPSGNPSVPSSLSPLAFRIAPICLSPCSKPDTMQVLFLNMSCASLWVSVDVSIWTDLRPLSQGPRSQGYLVLKWISQEKTRPSPMRGSGDRCLPLDWRQ